MKQNILRETVFSSNSRISQLKPVFSKMPNLRLPGNNLHMSLPQKVTVLSVTVGVLVIGFLARYLRRRRRVVNPDNLHRLERRGLRSSRGLKSPNGDVLSQAGGRRSASPGGRGLQRQASLLSSDRLSVASGSLGGGAVLLPGGGDAPAGTMLSPQQLGLMGMEALDTARASQGGGHGVSCATCRCCSTPA
ncbi:Mitoguardin [Gryllus bimaculatus]|nr:Mitoguardin [Gryllus bimaculatus]